MDKITVITKDAGILCRINMYTSKLVHKSNQDISTYHYFPTAGFYNE